MIDGAARPDPGQETAIRRWKLGHHVFHLYLLAMNTELPVALRHVLHERWQNLSDVLDRLTILYDASTASMKYAADFDSDQYTSLIRPSMSPPFMSPGFSGELNKDHSTMLALMKELRHTLKVRLRDSRSAGVPDEVATAATALWSAQARNRRHHMLVCERFVPDGGSLLREYFSRVESDGHVVGKE
ncbi:MAG: hypothetical protein HOQ24_19885 [Mycobacteriaceae bacterium]|nr:hypothetical protein [Mycobacteriaceae bacterium]